MRHLRSLLLGLLLGPWLALGALAQVQLKVLGDFAFPPYSSLRGTEPVGIDVDILHELGRRTGVQFQIELVPFKRVVESVRAGTVDGGMALLRSAEREGFALFTGVMHNSTYSLFVTRDSKMEFDGLASLHGKRIGKVRGFFISPEFDAEVAAERIQLHETAGAEQGLHMLMLGRVDAISGQTVVTRYLARQLGYADSVRPLPTPLVPDRPTFLVLSRASKLPDKEALAERLRLALEAMHKDGSIERIEARHLQ
ncbi:substrate-binding periplasmic protein [Inhella sp.]|uniref:substrate-binding periplasmic protein n=1 Tax=Inhella sp. TaxID=1921806 RepID=UPI0035B39BA1